MSSKRRVGQPIQFVIPSPPPVEAIGIKFFSSRLPADLQEVVPEGLKYVDYHEVKARVRHLEERAAAGELDSFEGEDAGRAGGELTQADRRLLAQPAKATQLLEFLSRRGAEEAEKIRREKEERQNAPRDRLEMHRQEVLHFARATGRLPPRASELRTEYHITKYWAGVLTPRRIGKLYYQRHLDRLED